MVGCPHGGHQRVGGPHGEVDGKDQTEYHELGAGIVGDVSEVHPEQVHHFLRQKIREDGHHAGDVQIQQTQQGADENEEGKDHEQQVKGQRRTLHGHIMPPAAMGHQYTEAEKSVFRQGVVPHSSVSLREDFTPTWPRRPGSSPQWLPCHCGRWGC